MALIERIWNDTVIKLPSPRLHPVEVAQMGKSHTIWFGRVPRIAFANEQPLLNQVCRKCPLCSHLAGSFNDYDLKEIVVDDRLCTGIYLNVDDSILFRKEYHLEAVAPRGTFSKPDPRAACAK